MTVIFLAGTPQRSRHAPADEPVLDDVGDGDSGVAGQFRRQIEPAHPDVILRRSMCVAPSECSVVSTTGVPASRAAGRA